MPSSILRTSCCLALAACCALPAACGDDGAAPGVGVVFAATAQDGCANLPTGDRKLPADVDRIVVVVRGDDGTERASSAVAAADVTAEGAVLLTGVPAGTWRLEVAGCQGGTATWWGVDPALVIEASAKSSPVVFLRPAGGLACIGGENRSPLAPAFNGDDFLGQGRSAFAAAAAGPGGRVVVSGTGVTATSLAGDFQLKGGGGAWEYHPGTGLFTAVRSADGQRLRLTYPRLGHGAAFLDADTVAVFGGAVQALVPPDAYPVSEPVVQPDRAPGAAIELVSLAAGVATPVPGLVADAWPAVASDAPTGGVARRLAMAGGLAGDGTASAAALFVTVPADGTATPAALEASAVTGTLATPRFGGTARFLVNGDLLLAGGWDGTHGVAPEVDWVDGDAVRSSLLAAGFPPPDRQATVFPAVAVLADSGTEARVLVVGGNPVTGGAAAFGDPKAGQTNAWILTLQAGADGHYAPSTIEAYGADDWAARSLAAIAPFDPVGAATTGRFLLAGGYRAFVQMIDAPDCAASAENHVCFPDTVTAFTAGTTALETVLQVTDTGRLGATVAPIGSGAVLVLGGLAGIGPGSPLPQSSGVVAFAGGPDLDAVCAAHPAP